MILPDVAALVCYCSCFYSVIEANVETMISQEKNSEEATSGTSGAMLPRDVLSSGVTGSCNAGAAWRQIFSTRFSRRR